MKRLKSLTITLFISCSILIMGCESTSGILGGLLGEGGSTNADPTSAEMSNGLKQTLELGIVNGADVLSGLDGYFGNAAIKILWPEEAQKIENKIRGIGLNKLADDVVLSFNRAAEAAAKEAAPVFKQAITGMTIQDAVNIVLGPKNSATEYLKSATRETLVSKYTPIIDDALGSVGATKYWGDATAAYNKIPLVKPINTDITAYVTDRALDGLFMMVEKEEAKIRENPIARTTDLLQKVFGWADRQKG